MTFDDFDDGGTGDRPGGPGVNGGAHLLRRGDAKALQRRRSVLFRQLLHQMVQRQRSAIFRTRHPGARQQIGVAAAIRGDLAQ